jgi:small subunit ribosomal protein S2
MKEISINDLLASGAHFGHLTRRWNPKMRKYIFMERNGIHIIDLKKTAEMLKAAQQAVIEIVRNGDSILFVGTKKQARDIIRVEAERCNMFYVTERWLGGTLTNFATIKKSIRRMKNLEKKSTDGTYDKITKKEILMIERELEKLNKVLGGIRDMNRLPGALFIVDTKREAIAVAEARRLDIPIIGMVDTNADPTVIDYPIPCNDDAFKSIALIAHAIADAVLEARSGVAEQQGEAAEGADTAAETPEEPATAPSTGEEKAEAPVSE